MGEYDQGFAKIFFCTVIFVSLLGSTCFASKYEVLQSKAIISVTGPETNATVSLERDGKIILDASKDAVAGAYSWKYLGGGPSEIKLWDKTTPSAYFWAGKPGVYRFSLEIKQDDAVIETREVTLTARELHYVNIDGFTEKKMNIRTHSVAYPSEWPSLLDISHLIDFVSAATIKTPFIDVKGFANPDTVTLQCKNLTAGLQYSGTSFIERDYLKFSFNNVVLQEGDNIIEVSAIDDKGVVCRDARFITYNPSVTFLRPLTLSPDFVSEGNDVNVKFSLQIKLEDENAKPEKIELYESTVSGDLLRKVAELESDETLGLGGYSVSLNLPRNAEEKYYRAAVNIEGRLQKSITTKLHILFNSLSMKGENHLRARNAIDAAVDEIIYEGQAEGKVTASKEELDRRMQRLAETLNAKEDVEYVYIRPKGEGIRVKFTSGIILGYSLLIISK